MDSIHSRPVNFSFEKLGRYSDLKKTGLVCEPEINRMQKKQKKRVWIFSFFSWPLFFWIANCKQKKCGPDPEKNRLDATLYFLKVHLKFVNLR